MAKYGLFMTTFCSLTLGISVAQAEDVDISGKTQVQVGTWSDLKTELEDSDNSGKAIVLTGDIVADVNQPIDSVVTDIIIDGGNHTLSGNAGGGRLINFAASQGNNVIIQNVNLNGFSNIQNNSYAYGGAIYSDGVIGTISANLTGNFAQTDSGYSFGGAIFSSEYATINTVTGQFEGNYVQSTSGNVYGGALYNAGTIDSVSGTFSKNYATSTSRNATGGAIYNGLDANIGTITATFTENYAQNGAGGALYNAGTIQSLIADFSNNYATGSGSSIYGGAILNNGGNIQNIQGNFSGNSLQVTSGYGQGGAIYNDGQMVIVNSNFTDNYVQTDATQDSAEGMAHQGGAIYTTQDITIKADAGTSTFSGNKVVWGDGETSSAIFIETADDGDVVTLNLNAQNGGVITFNDKISTSDTTLDKSAIAITGDATSNVIFNNQIENVGSINVSGTKVDVNSGVFYRSTTFDSGITNINAGANADTSIINSGGTMNVDDSAKIYTTTINTGGVVDIASGGYAEDTTVNNGGSLTTASNTELHTFLANDNSSLNIDADAVLSGDITIYAGANLGGTYDYGTIFKDTVVDPGSLTLVGGLNSAFNQDSLVNNTDSKKLYLTAGDYNVGDESQALSGWSLLWLKDIATVKLDGDVSLTSPAKKMLIENGSVLDLSGDSPASYIITGSVSSDGSLTFSHTDDEADDITTIYGNYKAYSNAQMTIDVNPTTNTSDMLRIDGDVEGVTDVVLNVLQNDVKPTELIKFVSAPYDDLTTGAYFNIFRVDGSAYKWNSLYKDHAWYTGTDDLIPDGSPSGYGDPSEEDMASDPNLEDDAVLPDQFPASPTAPIPDPEPEPEPQPQASVVGEAIAYMGLPSVGIEQTRGMLQNVSDKVASGKIYNLSYEGFFDCRDDVLLYRSIWGAPVYSYSDVKAPFSFEAEITGFEAGFDIQSDVYNRLGVFASYRQGSYDFDGDGEDYFSKTGSTVDIDSYILGLYHRYDESNMWTMGQLFLGYQDVTFSTDDGVSADTSGVEFGAGLEAGLIFNPLANLTIEPIISLAYTQIIYDDVSDDYGKTADFGSVYNLEIEAGIKVEETYLQDNGYAKIYFKPSIVQTISSGDVQVTSLRKVEGLDNATLGRIAIGGRMNLSESWSGFADASYTFGADYTNAAVNAGLNYAF